MIFILPGSNLTQMLDVYFPEGSLQFEIRTASKENLESEPSKRSRSTNFEESRRNLLKQVEQPKLTTSHIK